MKFLLFTQISSFAFSVLNKLKINFEKLEV